MRALKILYLPVIILTAYGLYLGGVIDSTIYTMVVFTLIAFALGQASVVLPEFARERRQSIAQIEEFIAHMHEALGDEDFPEFARPGAEAALSDAMARLTFLEATADPLTRWRERRAREKAAP